MAGRPREFDAEQVLDAAMRAFWARGYAATSMKDLMQATGLFKGSLYQAFGDKHSLFTSALRRYLEEMRRQKQALLRAAPTPLDGIRQVMHGLLDIADGDSECPSGCLAVNSLVELAPHDAEVEKILADHMRAMRASFARVIADAQAAGQIDDQRPPELVTGLLMTFLAGLAATLKGPLTQADAHRLLDAQLEAIL